MMYKNLLSAKELAEYLHPLDSGLPEEGGIKAYAPDKSSWLQQKQLQHYYKGRRHLLEGERVTTLGGLSRGEWRPDLKKVEVQKPGKFWAHMGHVENKMHLLFPEEALLLMDQGLIEVYYGGVPLSIQQGYATLLGQDIPIEHYQVYAHLIRLGYIVMRFNKVKVTSYERKIRLHQHVKTSKRKRRHEKISKETEYTEDKKRKSENDNVSDVTEHETDTNGILCDGDVQMEIEKPQETVPKLHREHFPDIESWTTEAADSVDQKPPRQSIPYSDWDFSQINIPSICNNKRIFELTQPNEKYLPPNIKWKNTTVTINIELLNSGKQRLSYEDLLEYSHGSAGWKAHIKAANWGEYKEQYFTKQELSDTALLPVAHLWDDEVTPLITPYHATSTRSILEKLKVIENVNLSSSQERLKNIETDLNIVYDVYIPDKKFRKSDCGIPSHRVCITRSCDGVAELGVMMQLSSQCTDGVPLMWAVVDNGDISFYAYHDVDLPIDVTMG